MRPEKLKPISLNLTAQVEKVMDKIIPDSWISCEIFKTTCCIILFYPTMDVLTNMTMTMKYTSQKNGVKPQPDLMAQGP